MLDEGMYGIAKGWLPSEPIIHAHTRTLAVGSCFAEHFSVWLTEHGFSRSAGVDAFEQRKAGFESAAVLAQQLRWAFGEIDGASLLWIDKDRRVVPASEESRLRLREEILGVDVLIATLGLSEVWYDNVTGEPLWRPLTRDKYEPERHVFRVESVATTKHWLDTIESIRRRHAPHLKIIYTVSPVPLAATFRPISAVTANCVSKATLRAALDEFLREHESVVGKEVFYLPSYEFATNLFGLPLQEDNRHVTSYVVGSILAFFAEAYCDFGAIQPRDAGELLRIEGGDEHERIMTRADEGHEVTLDAEMTHRIRELEAKVTELGGICAARQTVIEQLDTAARERLALIEQLHRVAEERLALIHRMEVMKGAT